LQLIWIAFNIKFEEKIRKKEKNQQNKEYAKDERKQ